MENAVKKRPPCRFLAAVMTGKEREARGLSHQRRWRLCTHAERPMGEVVCGCLHCKTCPKREDPPPTSDT